MQKRIDILSETECFPPAKEPSPAELTLNTLLLLHLKMSLTGYSYIQIRKVQYKEKVEAPQMEREQVYACML